MPFLLSHFSTGDKFENCSAQFFAVCWIVHVEFGRRPLRTAYRKRAADDEEGHRARVANIRCFAGSRVDNRAAGRHHDCGKESEARDAPLLSTKLFSRVTIGYAWLILLAPYIIY